MAKRKAARRGNGEGSIYYEAARDRYRGAVTLPDGRRRTVVAKTREGVKDRMAVMLGQAATGTLPASTTLTLRDQIEHWRDYVLPAKRLAPATAEQYRWALGVAESGLGKVKLATLSVEAVERFLTQLAREGYARNSVRLVRNALGQVLGEAERRGHVTRNVARLAHLPPDAALPSERRALEPAECMKLLKASEGTTLGALVALALATGARRGELLALSWDDVDLGAGTVNFRRGLRRAPGGGYEVGPTKTAASVRVVVIGSAARTQLRGHRSRQRKEQMASEHWRDSGLVFTNSVGGPLDPGRLRRAFEALCTRTGVEATFHELRHTVASHAVADDVPLATVADQLGHASIDMLARTYRHKVVPVVDVSASTERLVARPRRSRRATR
jgi:integrase